MDLKDAYRVVPVHPDDQHLLAISWNGAVYMDRSLPFGLRLTPKLFTAMGERYDLGSLLQRDTLPPTLPR